MAFSEITQQIVLRFQQRHAAGQEAYLGLMQDIEALIKGQPLAELPSVEPLSHRAPLPVDQREVNAARKACAHTKIIEGQRLSDVEEDAVLFSDIENL